MFGWISRSRLPQEETIDWLFDVFEWLLARTGGFEGFRQERKLVLPTDEFFPVARDQPPHDFAQAMFDATRLHAGMGSMRCDLVPDDETPSTRELLGNLPFEEKTRSAAGTYRHGGGVEHSVIGYSPSGLKEPEAFVATMAHELGHFLIHSLGSQAPGGDEAQEPATDVCAAFLGYGVFSANATFRFEQHSDGVMQGWSYRRLGYLGERPMSYALAIFLALQERPLREARRFLRPNPLGCTKNALLHLERERTGDLARLRVVTGWRRPATARSSLPG